MTRGNKYVRSIMADSGPPLPQSRERGGRSFHLILALAGPDSALALDLQNPVVAAVGNVEIAGGMQRDAMRLIQFGVLGIAAHARAAFLSGAGDADDLAGVRKVLANDVILGVGN